MRLLVLVAPDSFKGTIDAAAAAMALATGWRAARPEDDVREIPQADGGEGTASVVAAATPGSRWRDAGWVTGPGGEPALGRWLELPDGTALVELALTSGLTLLRRLDPLGAGTTGLGEVLRRAVEAGAPRVVVAVGGSASTDGGAGALVALGARVLDDDGAPVAPGGGGLARVARAERAELVPPPLGGVEVLVDVDAPLFGPQGAAAVFGPQKGAGPRDVAVLDAALRRWAAVLGGNPAEPGAGAAGGTAFGLAAGWGARLVPGAATIAAITGLSGLVARADVVLTGEGRFDATSLGGKVVGNVLRLAGEAGVGRTTGDAGLATAARRGLVCIVAGVLTPDGLAAAGEAGLRPRWAYDLATLAGSVEGAVVDPARWLRDAGERAARSWAG